MRKTFFTFIAIILFCCQSGQAQAPAAGRFPIGERLTYNISFASYPSAAFAETYVVSTGKYGDRDAVYLHGKVKTTDFVNAAFFSVNETRQILVTPDTGLPLLSRVINDENGMPREKVTDHKGPAAAHDWLSALFQLRFSTAPSGVLSIQEDNGSIVQASYQLAGKAHVKTTAGEFDTVVLDVQITSFPKLQIYLSDDERRIPVVVSYKHLKGVLRAELAGIQDLSPEPVADATPRPQNTPPPIAVSTPRPRATPLPYKNNQPLSENLPFDLGETLTYRLSRPGTSTSFGTLVVQAAERKQFFGKDSLLLSASVQQLTDSSSFFAAGDSIKSYVEPDSLLPERTEIDFHGALGLFNQMLQFDQATGKVTDSKGALYDIPVGTHDILSLAYAIRSFNLKEVKPNKSPSGDIRVALFTSDGPVILTILSQAEETIDFQGKKLTAQVVFASIGQSTVKLWISKDQDKLPLRINITSATFAFNADLISVVQNPPPVGENGPSANVPGIPADMMKNVTVINPNMINPTLSPSMLDTTVVNPAPTPAIKRP